MKYTPFTIFRKLKDKGIWHYIKSISHTIFRNLKPKYQRLYFFEYPLKEIIDQKIDSSVQVHRFTSMNVLLEKFALRRGHWYENQAKDLFSKGNICFAAIIENTITSCLWTSFNTVYFPDIEYILKVDSDVAPFIDGYTLDEYRGKGLYKILWNDCQNYLINTGKYSKIYGFINSSNKRSINVHNNLNLNKLIFHITLIKIFGIKIHFKKMIM